MARSLDDFVNEALKTIEEIAPERALETGFEVRAAHRNVARVARAAKDPAEQVLEIAEVELLAGS